MSGYSNFMTAVNPNVVETERYGVPGPEERPGSPEDRQMRLQHELERVWYWAQRTSTGLDAGPPMSDEEIAECCAEWRAAGSPVRKYERRKPKSGRISAARQLEIAAAAAESRRTA